MLNIRLFSCVFWALHFRHAGCDIISAKDVVIQAALSKLPMRPTTYRLLEKGRCSMLSWALTFLVIALIAAVFGFGGIAGTASSIAQVLFFVFLVLFLISLIIPRVRPPVA
jgi:uncharacterized membrane protein YtjA (UPF0391 family)